MGHLLPDLRIALTSLVRTPAFTAIVGVFPARSGSRTSPLEGLHAE